MTTAAVHLRQQRPIALAVAVFGALALAVVVVAALNVDREAGPTKGSGVPVEQTRTVAPFAAIDLAGAGEVFVHVGARQNVVVTADDNVVERVGTTVQDDTLVISTRGSFEPVVPLTVDVTVPELEGATLSGAGALDVDAVQAETFEVRLTGVGLLVATGAVGSLDASLAGAGEARLETLVARDVVATLSGDGRLGVRATRSLQGTVRGAGAIVYVGNPRVVKRDIAGTGAIVEG